MRKEEIDAFAARRPFEPFTIRLIDGRTFTFRSPEQYIVSRTTIHTLDKKGDGLLISIAMIATIHSLNGNGHASKGRR